MIVRMPVTRQFLTTFEKGMEFMPHLKNVYSKHPSTFKEYPSVPMAALMVPGSVALGTCFIASMFVDLINYTALAALNLLGIAITLGNSSRSALFRSNLEEHKQQFKDISEIIITSAFYASQDMALNIKNGSIHTIKVTSNAITKVYFSILDRTPISRFYPDQA